MAKIEFQVEHLNLYYDKFHALHDLTLDIYQNEITALIGPSGCGKSTFIKTLNRMNDLVEGCKIDGTIKLNNVDIYKDYDIIDLRKKVGMVFQKPNPFPMSVYDNIAYGPRIHGIKKKAQLDDIVEEALTKAFIWDEGSAEEECAGAVRRPAAEAVYCAGSFHLSGGCSDGRADLRIGSSVYPED